MLFSFNKLHLQMEELEQKHLHLLQVVESEKTAKWQYTQHCEELTEEIKKLRTEVNFNRASPSSLVCFFFFCNLVKKTLLSFAFVAFRFEERMAAFTSSVTHNKS